MSSSTNRGLGFILCCSAVVVALYGHAAFGDQFCSNNGGASPYVCLEKSGPLFLDTHFRLDFSNPPKVDITLLLGSQSWKLWSQVSEADTTPANLGDVTLKPSVDTDNFAVTIENGTTGGPGAAYLVSMVLKDTDAGATWVGNSGISTGTISGNLTGDLEVVEDAAGGGGSVKLTVLGDTTGTLDIARIAPSDQLRIDGTASGDITITGDIEYDSGTSTKGTVDIGTATGS